MSEARHGRALPYPPLATLTTHPRSRASQPASAGREKREKKQVEAFTIEVKEKDDDFKIEQGAGEKLAEIENVVFKIGKFDSASDELKTLHRLCFGRAGQKTKVKRNLREFSGFVFENVKAEKEKKAAVLNKTSTSTKLLKGMLDVCDLSPSGTKAQLVERLLDFLEKPEASGTRASSAVGTGPPLALAAPPAHLLRQGPAARRSL